MTDQARGTPLPPHVRVAVVGAGFGGLAAAIGLLRSGERDLVVLERADEVGGTWRDNSYPGCACDVPSHLYSLSYAPFPGWSHRFARQQEIQDYLVHVADTFGVRPYVRFGSDVRGAAWDRVAQRWRLSTTAGDLTADVVVSAAGPLSEPAVPDIEGLGSFAGTTFHSAAWDHDHDLTGRRVAVLGTGASAIQFVPHVQRRAGHLTLFQRTAPWVLPRGDRPITHLERELFRRVPLAQRVARAAVYWGRETWVVGFRRLRLMRLAERRALRDLERAVPDPTLRTKLTPTYRLGCKRVLMSNDYYPALTRPDVEVVTDRIERVLPHAVVTVDAAGRRREHPVDTIILGTGFRATHPPLAPVVVGTDGRSLADHWADGGMQAYLGLSVAGFPSFFHLLGPNTGLGHTSVVLMLEAQVRYLVDLLGQAEARGATSIEPQPRVQAAYNEWVQQQLEGTVWNAGGCSSWYLDEHGRNTTLWPTFVPAFRARLRRPRIGDYRLGRSGRPTEDGPVSVAGRTSGTVA